MTDWHAIVTIVRQRKTIEYTFTYNPIFCTKIRLKKGKNSSHELSTNLEDNCLVYPPINSRASYNLIYQAM